MLKEQCFKKDKDPFDLRKTIAKSFGLKGITKLPYPIEL